jgi:hypothetical protein
MTGLCFPTQLSSHETYIPRAWTSIADPPMITASAAASFVRRALRQKSRSSPWR